MGQAAVRTVCDSAVVRFLEEAVGGEGVADTGVLWLGEMVVDGIIETLISQSVLHLIAWRYLDSVHRL